MELTDNYSKGKSTFRAVLRMLGPPKLVQHFILFSDETPRCQKDFMRHQISIDKVFVKENYKPNSTI